MTSAANKAHLALLRALRGTEHYAGARAMLHELRLERAHRKRVERLRVDQSARLYRAARALGHLLHEHRISSRDAT